MTEATNYLILSTPMAHTFPMHGCHGEFIVSVLLIIGSNTLSRSQTLNKFPSHSTSTGFSFPPRQAPFLVPLPRKSFATFLSFDKLVSCIFHRPLSHPADPFPALIPKTNQTAINLYASFTTFFSLPLPPPVVTRKRYIESNNERRSS